jgi:glutamyl-tRNA synthetase
MVIFRPDGYPTYNFAVVVDDWDMGITEVIRGDDHINNTPRQINLYEAIGASVPKFGHMPMILDEQGAKLSKRTGAADVMQYKDAGYLPHALVNYLARLGWSHGDQEIFSREELVELFDVRNCNSKAARLDMAKLGWVNQHYLKTDDPATIAPQLAYQLEKLGLDVAAGPAPVDVVVALRERVQTLKEMAEKAMVWYVPLENYDEGAVAKHLKAGADMPLAKAREMLAALPEWTVEGVSAALHDAAAALELGMGKVAQPLRVAITGTQVSPDISYTVYLAGREQALKRIDAALIKIATA